jgi:hypothetical protein
MCHNSLCFFIICISIFKKFFTAFFIENYSRYISIFCKINISGIIILCFISFHWKAITFKIKIIKVYLLWIHWNLNFLSSIIIDIWINLIIFLEFILKRLNNISMESFKITVNCFKIYSVYSLIIFGFRGMWVKFHFDVEKSFGALILI